jgi:hypothetical protein
MTKQPLFVRLAWILFLGGLFLYILSNQPYSTQQQGLSTSLSKVVAWLDADQKEQLQQTGMLDQLLTCDLDLSTSLPRSMRIGKPGFISLTARLDCPSGVNLQKQIFLRTKLVEEQNRVTPMGEILTQIQPSDVINNDWVVISKAEGSIAGSLWVYLDIVVADEQVIQLLVASIPIQTKVESILDLNQHSLNWILSGLSGIGAVLLVIHWLRRLIPRKKIGSKA